MADKDHQCSALDRREQMRAEEVWKQENARRAASLRKRQIQLVHTERAEATRQRREVAQARKAEQEAEQHRQRQHSMQEKILLSERRRVQTSRTSTSVQRPLLSDKVSASADAVPRAASPPITPTASAITNSSYKRLIGRNHAEMMVLSRRVHRDPVAFMKELINESGADSEAFHLSRPPSKWR